jgi:hypothetical protein
MTRLLSETSSLKPCRGCAGFTTHFEGCPIDDVTFDGRVREDQRGEVDYDTVPWDQSADQPAQRAQPPEPSPMSPSSFSPWCDVHAPLRLHYAREAEMPECPPDPQMIVSEGWAWRRWASPC